MQWHDLCKAFLVEAKWQYQSYRPSFDEYLDNGWITSTGPLLLLHAFPMLKQNGLMETRQQIITDTCFGSSSNDSNSSMGYPRLVELSSRIFRLCNDCATHKVSQSVSPSLLHAYVVIGDMHAGLLAMETETL